jgi:hypothetical protein
MARQRTSGWRWPIRRLVRETGEVPILGGAHVATNPQYEDAKAKVDARIGFFVHAAVFTVLNLVFLIAIGWDWLWVTLFWGVGLVMHGVATFISGRAGCSTTTANAPSRKRCPETTHNHSDRAR